MASALDTNVLVYLLSSDVRKADISKRLLNDDIIIGVQVLNELTNVARRKAGLDWPEIDRLVDGIKRLCTVMPLTIDNHDDGRRLARRYGLSMYDALICSAALDAKASPLYSEDMHHGLVIDDVLRIVNPYLETPT